MWAPGPGLALLLERARVMGCVLAQVTREDAIYNIGRIGLLVRCFETGDLDQLAEGGRATALPCGCTTAALTLTTMGGSITCSYERQDAPTRAWST